MSDVNISKVHVLNVPIDREYKHTFYFANQTAQENYFTSKKVKSFTDFTYQRKDSKMRIPVPFDEAIKYNYVMYQNKAYSDKWFYAFITDYEFKGEDSTNITIETDVIQTWMFDYEIKPSFVEREHVNDDTIGLHTVPENVEMGEYIIKNQTADDTIRDLAVVFGVTTLIEKNSEGKATFKRATTVYNGICGGVIYYAFKIEDVDGSVKAISDFISLYDDNGRADAIVCMFYYPYDLLTLDTNNRVKGNFKTSEYTIEDNLLDKKVVYGYHNVKNKKLLTYPYIYLLASNNNGGSAIYQYEHFTNATGYLRFSVNACICPGGSIRMIPMEYKSYVKYNEEEGLNLGKFPICNWTSDVYTNWLTQNSVNIGLNMISGLGQIVAGVGMAVGTGGVGAAVGGSTAVGGVSTIANQLAQIHQMSMTPPQAKGNVNAGDVIGAQLKNRFSFYHMSIKPEYQSIIDEYFSTYGYKINRVKVPNKNHRANWWFTKTIDVNIEGAIPLMDLQKIKDCYNIGITFWKNPANFKNYDVSNEIIS